jgi:hypothetical protein
MSITDLGRFLWLSTAFPFCNGIAGQSRAAPLLFRGKVRLTELSQKPPVKLQSLHHHIPGASGENSSVLLSNAGTDMPCHAYPNFTFHVGYRHRSLRISRWLHNFRIAKRCRRIMSERREAKWFCAEPDLWRS